MTPGPGSGTSAREALERRKRALRAVKRLRSDRKLIGKLARDAVHVGDRNAVAHLERVGEALDREIARCKAIEAEALGEVVGVVEGRRSTGWCRWCQHYGEDCVCAL